MMNRFEVLILITVFALMLGCQSVSSNKATSTTIPNREMKVIKSAAKSITGKDVSDEDIYRLANQLLENSEIQSAVESVTNGLTQKSVIYYCPIDGKRFSPAVKTCPDHNVELMLVE